MGKKYLNKNAKFQCGNGNAVWFSPQSGDFKVKINGAEALLDDCRIGLIGGPRPGQCNLVPDPSTGAPGPCTAVIVSGSWDNCVSLKVGGKGVLSSGCSISCPVGGTIRPFKPTIMALNVDDGADARTADIARKDGSDSGGDGAGGTGSADAPRSDSGNVSIEEQETESTERRQEDGEERDIAQEAEYALCDYKNCGKAKACKYLKVAHTLNESRNAAELKVHMGKDTFDLYAGDCGAVATSLYGDYLYSIAHHHIVPANQCFKTFAEIVKLANYYGYDINKAENGISLPTMNAGYDRNPFEERKKIAFHAMKVLGRQWHKGGHEYSCRISAEIDSVLPKPFRHYKDAVDSELTSFRIKLNDELKCRADNYEQQAAEFTRIMDHICERVAKKLRKFEDSPRQSYPFFVSKLAFYYAYQEELSGYEEELFGKDG